MSKRSAVAAIVFAAQSFFAPQSLMASSASASIQVSVTQPQPVPAGTTTIVYRCGLPARMGAGVRDFVALLASPNPVNAGSNLTWTMTVTNNGPSSGVNASADRGDGSVGDENVESPECLTHAGKLATSILLAARSSTFATEHRSWP